MTSPPQEPHVDFEAFGESWDLALDADGYSANTLRSYRRALLSLAGWMATAHPGVGPIEMTRDHIRAWIVATREATSSGTARSHFAGVKHFGGWLVNEGERADNPAAGIKTPAPNEVSTPVLKDDEVRALLATCGGRTFRDRRDRALILVFLDCGLRISEVHGLTVDDIDVRSRMLLATGKGTNRSGPRRRQVSFGAKLAQALDRYLRERRRHPYAVRDQLWLGDRGRANLSQAGIDAVLDRRAAEAGLSVHAHQLRHTWASAGRRAGLSDGDMMSLGGWRSRAMLDRYGAADASDRATEAYRRVSYGDRL